MIVGCYCLHLYCDHKDHAVNATSANRNEPAEYGTGMEHGSQARRAARRDGWVLHKDGTTTCPECNPARRAHTGQAARRSER